jgi:hypothetical protein
MVGMTRIVVDDLDNEPDDLVDDGPDDGGSTSPATPPAAPPAAPPAPDGDMAGLTREQLLAELDKVRRGNQRNNSELKKTRQLRNVMTALGIESTDDLLARLGQGAPPAGATAPPATPLADPPATPPPATPPAAAPPSDAEVQRLVALEVEKIRATQEQEAEQEAERVKALTAKLRVAGLRTALADAGFTGVFDRAIRVVDLDSIQVGEDGEITGLPEVVASLRTDIPEWFRPRGGGPRRSGGEDVDGGHRGTPPQKKQGWEAQTLGRMLSATPRR